MIKLTKTKSGAAEVRCYNRLPEVLAKKEVTQRALATALKRDFTYVNRLCTESVKPNVFMAVMIAQYLGVSVEEIWTVEGFIS